MKATADLCISHTIPRMYLKERNCSKSILSSCIQIQNSRPFYLLQQDISTDELLTLWKGHLSFKQYLSLKSSKFRIKTFELWEPSYFHLRSFIVCNRKETALKSPLILKDTVKTTATVLKLSQPLLHKSCTLWLNNY